jgi:transcriptional regulator with XRE-family HTH domain
MPVQERLLPMMPTATFPDRLRKMMASRRLNQSDVARLVGYTPTGVWNWLQGNTLPRAETLTALAGVLDVTEDWLRDGDTARTEDLGAPTQITSANTLADKVERLRREIAALTGYDVEGVKVTLELASR